MHEIAVDQVIQCLSWQQGGSGAILS